MTDARWIAVPFALAATLALAADPPSPADARGACKADVEKLCPSVAPGDGRIIRCLKENAASISPTCKDAMAKARANRGAGATAPPKG